jgi:uracil-DNA glycosylase
MAGELDRIAKEVSECTKCPLHKSRTKAVPGEGSSKAKLLFIGEAPGYHEDIQGQPFVGQSGQLLGHLLTAIKTTREDVFITNVVKCRPPENRDPKPEEIEACRPYLDRQLAALDPGVVITLGRFSMARWFAGERISQIHGKPKTEGGRIIMPMFHPAAALRDRTGPTMKAFKEDGLTIPALLKEAEEIASTQLWGSLNQATLTPEAETTPKPSEQLEQVVAEAKAEQPIVTLPEEKEAVVPPKETKRKKAISKAVAETPTEYNIEVPAVLQAESPVQKIEPATDNAELAQELDKKKPARPARKKKEAEKPVAEQLSLF